MTEAKGGGPPVTETKVRSEQDIRKGEIAISTRKRLSSKAQEIHSKPAGTRSSEENRLVVYEAMRTGRYEDGKRLEHVEFGGKGITMPKFSFERGEKEYSFDTGTVTIDTLTSKGNGYEGSFIDSKTGETLFWDADGNIVRRKIAISVEDKNKRYAEMNKATSDGLTLLQVPLSREEASDAQALSEESAISGIIEDADDQQLFGDYIKLIKDEPVDITLDTDALISRVAASTGMLRKADVEVLVALKPDLTADLDQIKGQILVSIDDLQGVFNGESLDTFLEEQFTSLQSKATDLEGQLKADGADTAAIQTELDDVNAQLSAVDRAATVLAEDAKMKAVDYEIADPSKFKEMDTLATGVLENHIAQLQAEIEGGKYEGRELLEKRNLLAQLFLARKVVGEEYGAMVRFDALSRIQEESSGAKTIVQEGTYAQAAEVASKKFDAFLESNGIDEFSRLEIIDKLKTQNGLLELIEDSRFANMAPDFVKGVFGTSDADVFSLIDNAALARQDLIDSGMSNRLREIIARNPGKRAGIAALILLALLSTPFVIGTGAALMGAKAMSGQR